MMLESTPVDMFRAALDALQGDAFKHGHDRRFVQIVNRCLAQHSLVVPFHKLFGSEVPELPPAPPLLATGPRRHRIELRADKNEKERAHDKPHADHTLLTNRFFPDYLKDGREARVRKHRFDYFVD